MKFVCKLFPLVLLITAFALTACGGGGGGTAPATTDSSSTNTTTSTSTSTNSTSTSTITTISYETKAPTEAKAVGDIVFNDGSAIPYTSGLLLTDAQKSTAVAYIFYKGTDCSNDGSTRTLGVGLKRSHSGKKWGKFNDGINYPNGPDVANGFGTNITTIQCTPCSPTDGSYDAYTFTGDKNGSDNLSQIGEFLESVGKTDDTGTAGNYPAFDYAKNYGTANGCTGAYATGWYLPSIAELFQIQKEKANIDAVVALCDLTDSFSSV